MKRPALVIALLMIVVSGAAALHAQSPASIMAKLDELIEKVDALLPEEKTTTTLLFPYAINQAGFDTGITVSNYGDASGSCILTFVGAAAPAALTVPLAAGGQYVNTLSFVAPGFQGFIRVNCDFPTARGWGLLTDLGAQNIAAGIPVEVLP